MNNLASSAPSPSLLLFRFCSAVCILAAAAVPGGCTTRTTSVAQYGAMRQVMREGQTEPRIRLTDAVAAPHAYGVGALEGLTGEVTIVDGSVWVARVAHEGVDVSGPAPLAHDQATLLTLAHIASWESVPVTTTIEGAALESSIKAAARDMGIDTSKPFPFVIEGDAIRVDLHVVNGYCPSAVDPATIDAQPWVWSSPAPGRAVIVGFYAPDAAGVMTHHATAVHLHAVVDIDGRTVAGHVDEAAAGAGAVLRLPSAR
ncbi:MAG: acetolactate decarboxylase [Phycisphaerales bacterium]|nr:acetolactate decarboxylase [Phycisphaerales bacterium]